MTGTLALDIETVSPDREPTEGAHFRDSSYFELLAVGLGYRPEPGAAVERTVLFREDGSPDAELALLDAVGDWCGERGADTLLTYNGTDFDLLHLDGRADLAGEAAGDQRTDRLAPIRDLDHVDLMADVEACWGGRRNLEWVCGKLDVAVESTKWADYDHGLDPDEWRSFGDRGAEAVKNTDVPRFGERYLALADVDARGTVTFRALGDLLADYTLADIEPLFELLDRRPFGE